MMKAVGAIAGVVCGLFALVGPAAAQDWPSAKPITIVVPLPPGPTIDQVARIVAAKLAKSLGQTVVVENRPGANGTIGSNIVAHAAPDGYTLLATSPSHVTAIYLMKNLPFDPVKDFTPIMAAVEPVTALVVNADLPVNSVKELIAYAKANPGKLSYGSSGIGSVFHLTGELFNRTAGVNITHVPYRGVAKPMQDVAAGHIQLMHISLSSARGALGFSQSKGPRHPGASSLRQVAEHSLNDRDPSGLPQAVDLVRLFRSGTPAAGDRRAAQRRDEEGDHRAGDTLETRGAGFEDRRRHAAGVCRAAKRRHQGIRRDHQGGRAQTAITIRRFGQLSRRHSVIYNARVRGLRALRRE